MGPLSRTAALAIVAAVSIGCEQEPRPAMPVMPAFIGVDHEDCSRCGRGRSSACGTSYIIGCGPQGDRCEAKVPCDPACCADRPEPTVGTLDDEPWGPFVARARAAPAPSGFVAFVARGPQGASISAVPAAGGEPLRLTRPDAALEGVSWSTSGRRVAFVRTRTTSLVGLTRVLTLDLEHLVYDASDESRVVALAWAGDRLLLEDAEDDLREIDYTPDGTRWATFRSGVSIGSKEGVTEESHGAPFPTIERLRWHPSGAFFAYWVPDADRPPADWRLVFATIDGMRWADTGLTARGDSFLDYVFSADGLFIAHATRGPDGGGELEIRVASIDALSDSTTIATVTRPVGLGFIPAELEPQLRILAEAPLPGPSTATFPHAIEPPPQPR